MSAPLLPLDVLVGYTVTTLDAITYTLTPTEGPAPMDLDETCPRCHFHGGYHAEDCDQLEDEPNPDDQFQSRAEWREVPQ